MPPTYKAKTTKKDWGSAKLNLRAKLGAKLTPVTRQQLGDLTYGECDAFATDLARVSNRQEAIKLLGDDWKRCTLQTRVAKAEIKKGEITWKERCKDEAIHNS